MFYYGFLGIDVIEGGEYASWFVKFMEVHLTGSFVEETELVAITCTCSEGKRLSILSLPDAIFSNTPRPTLVYLTSPPPRPCLLSSLRT